MQDGSMSIEEVVALYYDTMQKKKELDKLTDEEKKKFTKAMDWYFSLKPNRGKSSEVFTVAYDDEDGTRATGGDYKVTKVQRKSIIWDIDKLKKQVPEGLWLDVIDTDMHCIDAVGLVRYVRSLGADPKVFRSFFSIEHTVNTDGIDRLSEVGKITQENIEGCYEIKEGKPWYRVTFKAAGDEDD